jgi:H+/Cl- antiporter ClcA
VPVGLDLAMVVLYILSLLSALVGMSLGVLLPTLFPGICSGLSLALLVGTFLGGNLFTFYFPIVGGVLALIGAILSVR